MTFEKGTPEFSMMQDFFLLVKKYATPLNSDEYWDSMIKDFNELTSKYDPACEGLALKLGLAYMTNREQNRQKYYDVSKAQEK